MDKLCRYLDKELEELENKVGMGGKLSRTEIEDGKNLAKFKMALLTNEAMEEDAGYSNDYWIDGRTNRGNSYARGRYAKRDAMERYSRERGYNRDDARDEMVEDLRELMQSAPDEQTKKEFQKFINRMETM